MAQVNSGSVVRELKQCRQVSAAGGYTVAGSVTGERGRLALARRNVRKALLREYVCYLGETLAQAVMIAGLCGIVLIALL